MWTAKRWKRKLQQQERKTPIFFPAQLKECGMNIYEEILNFTVFIEQNKHREDKVVVYVFPAASGVGPKCSRGQVQIHIKIFQYTTTFNTFQSWFDTRCVRLPVVGLLFACTQAGKIITLLKIMKPSFHTTYPHEIPQV